MRLGATLSVKGSKSVPGPFSVNPGGRDSWGGGEGSVGVSGEGRKYMRALSRREEQIYCWSWQCWVIEIQTHSSQAVGGAPCVPT